MIIYFGPFLTHKTSLEFQILKLNQSELHGQEECKITQHEFQNHVETQVHDQPMPGTRPSPDYLEPDLIQSRVLAYPKITESLTRV